MDNRITIKFEVDITDVIGQIMQLLNTSDKDKEEQEPLSLLDAYTIDEAAKVLGVSKSYMYELAKHKDFPAMKIHGRKIIIPRRGLEEWMQKKFEEEKGTSKVIAMGGRR
ncbi:excision promoter, Xis [Thermoanaerobacter mathranii subsp. mathranii str. A3]|uniref:Excision promoter, Xis n=1 Tax=Thermoanaerobacter mathranii subsp. mathranii (strain DSM 11426 / CCUG 53645 / CIP 108742 / A3) TaxID=583358 RepID=A0ABN3Z224_THEM3|nr:helix-turn-helix domain-containing protein [Thermoanaerobacter mathranii]ADH59840.1 excision promoter, Xis [Thermoanaerobacter mathranii subsp. mathranii str. A3]